MKRRAFFAAVLGAMSGPALLSYREEWLTLFDAHLRGWIDRMPDNVEIIGYDPFRPRMRIRIRTYFRNGSNTRTG